MNPTLLFKYFLVLVLCSNLAFAQTKHDKALSKADAQYNQGAFDKASKSYDKFFKKANSKLGQQNKYTPIYYSRQARLSLANGQLVDFNSQIENAIKASITINGESSLTHAYAQIDIAELYLDYGHFKKAREITEVVQQQLKNEQLQDDALKAKVTLVLAEALTGQGFCREALTLLSEVDQFLLSKAVDREQVAEGDKIVKKRIPENELPIRFGNYAQLVTLRAQAYAKMGETTKADSAFVAARNWISKKNELPGRV